MIINDDDNEKDDDDNVNPMDLDIKEGEYTPDDDDEYVSVSNQFLSVFSILALEMKRIMKVMRISIIYWINGY